MGKPIIAWVIELVKKSKLVESIYVSTDEKNSRYCRKSWS